MIDIHKNVKLRLCYKQTCKRRDFLVLSVDLIKYKDKKL